MYAWRVRWRRNFNGMAKASTASAEKDMVDRPNLESHVFCRVLDDIGEVATDDNRCAPPPPAPPSFAMRQCTVANAKFHRDS